MSRLRAKCPVCKTFTAVALGPEYQCHACGTEFAAGLVRVPRAWGTGGEAMAEAASLELAGQPEWAQTLFVGGLKRLPIRYELRPGS